MKHTTQYTIINNKQRGVLDEFQLINKTMDNANKSLKLNSLLWFFFFLLLPPIHNSIAKSMVNLFDCISTLIGYTADEISIKNNIEMVQ